MKQSEKIYQRRLMGNLDGKVVYMLVAINDNEEDYKNKIEYLKNKHSTFK